MRNIAGYYWKQAPSVGLDPLLAFAQMLLETGNISSGHARRPECNPAGIGITGPNAPPIVFGSWRNGVAAHLGRLLAYALSAGTGTEEQAALIATALEWRPLPSERRGVAPRLGGLSERWAADPDYADKIARIARDIRSAWTHVSPDLGSRPLLPSS